MCGALPLPLIPLRAGEAHAYVVACFAVVVAAAWTHVAGMVDDRDSVRRVTRSVLERDGQRVVEASSGYAEDDRVRRVVRSGEIPFVRKPFSAEALQLETQKALRADTRT